MPNKPNRLMFVTFAVLSLVGIRCAHADSIRCENKLVSPGASLYEVKAKCGQPDDALHRTEIRTITHEVSAPCANVQQRTKCSRSVESSIEVVIDELTYDFGSNRFIEYLRFENGRLLSITDGEYGKKSN